MNIKYNKLGKSVLGVSISVLMMINLVIAAEPAVSTFAGTGDSSWKDGKRLEANFLVPYGLAMDKEGNILVADSFNNRIRKISGDTVTTVSGFSDKKDSYGLPRGGYFDGADIAKSEFNKPRDIVVDSKGNIFVADTGNFVIRKISVEKKKVFTYAGIAKEGYLDGAVNVAMFGTLSGICIDSKDNLYVADSSNNVIRKISTDGIVSTFAGKYNSDGGYKNGVAAEALFNEPADIAIAKDGSLYVLDSGNQMIRKIKDGQVTTISGGRDAIMEGTNYAKGSFADGSSKNARFNFPKGICISDDGTIFVADTWNQKIRVIKTDGIVITLAGTGKAGKVETPLAEAQFNGPVSILYNKGNLYISDMWNNTIRAIEIDITKLQPLVDKNLQGITFMKIAEKGNPQIWLDKKAVLFTDIKPYYINGSTVASLKAICLQWGAAVKIDTKAGTVTITKGDFNKVLIIDNNNIFMKDGKAMVSVRYLAENIGFGIAWVPEYKAIVITTK